MATETKTGIKCDYICDACGITYQEQRNLDENQFFTACQKAGCNGTYQLVNETEFTYEQELPPTPIITPVVEEVTE